MTTKFMQELADRAKNKLEEAKAYCPETAYRPDYRDEAIGFGLGKLVQVSLATQLSNGKYYLDKTKNLDKILSEARQPSEQALSGDDAIQFMKITRDRAFKTYPLIAEPNTHQEDQ